ncbi:MAG: alpha-ketoglutarate-dependent dioxygenase AlkB [Pseudomonadota bacterium]
MTAPSDFEHHAATLDVVAQRTLVAAIRTVIAQAPLYTPTMPRTGKPLSVRMTNCGVLGWLTDKDGGYRYAAHHPVTGAPWPDMPTPIAALWERFAGAAPPPEACLINWYEPGTKLGLHVDADEQDTAAPVVSISLGDDAWFRIGGLKRRDPTERLRLASGDVVVLGGNARRAYHGVDRIIAGTGTLLDTPGRFNLTLRRVSKPN